ncbi:tRNA lysidine(34) synthetase TilS [Halanaerobium kushneri]|uniref:tRNA(Ile)-lysidine synthase n=1 Tax=Halanaerobium kushneri TaxID=56779 RepID=A0A1N7BWA6_9FIRM|nr:tRNA lysidine(34) synthetase TilS [Halanaerobium kushneri]SIR55629.1 tRNA(Ile)-lysidine synthase [Halanaerobium kushneri]
MEAKFRNYIIKNNLLDNCKKLLLAVSGGPDSLVMLELFSKLKEDFDLEIAVAHLDHMLRKESAAEAKFVKNYTEKKGFDFFAKQVNLPALIKKNNSSIEAMAREIRLNFFKKIIKNYNYDLLALAHHRDDQAETVLLNLFRGSGLQGLSGIKAKTEVKGIKIIHPLLEFSKAEILSYCRKNNLKPRFDSSNNEDVYSRNIIRNKIFPLVEKKINKNAREVIARNSNLIAAENKFLQKIALKEYNNILNKEEKNTISVDFNKFIKLDQVLQRRIYRHIYKKLNNNLDDFYLEHIREIEKLIQDKKTGRGIDIAADIRVEISYSNLIFFKKENMEKENMDKIKYEPEKKLKIDQERILESEILDINDFSFTNDSLVAAFDYEKLNLPLFLRNRKPGDSFKPLGMSGHKKVKDILIDQKVPKPKRDELLLVVDSNDNILWLVPYKISDTYKITKETDKVLILKLKY